MARHPRERRAPAAGRSPRPARRPLPGGGAVIAVPTGDDESPTAWRLAFDAGVYYATRSPIPPSRGGRACSGCRSWPRTPRSSCDGPPRSSARRCDKARAVVAGAGAPASGRRRLTAGTARAVSVTGDGGRADPRRERRGRALMGVVAASALAYPLLVCAVQLVFAQLLTVDVARDRAVAAARPCSAASRSSPPSAGGPRAGCCSPWLLLGLAPPALYELWLVWPALTRVTRVGQDGGVTTRPPRDPRAAPPRRERVEQGQPLHRLGGRPPVGEGPRGGRARRPAAGRARPAARRPAHLGAAAGDHHRRARAGRGRPAVDPGAPVVAAQRAALRRAAGQGQGGRPSPSTARSSS